MAQDELDVTGIGNAIVDVFAQTTDEFLHINGLVKGAMRLIDAAEADRIYAKMGPGVEVSGGSAGNTMAGIASLGGKGAYIGKVADDQLGEVFAHDIRATGTVFTTRPLVGGAPTARSLILVTPDAQRTMNTFLGACVELGPEDIDRDLIAKSKVTYLEGYLFDKPKAKEAFLEAARTAHRAGRKVSVTLSDKFCVERHRESFLDLVANHVDIVFANESEICALYQCERFEDALEETKRHCETAALTRSGKGSVIFHQGEIFEVSAERVERVVDTTGAGDLYASGFLYGYTHGAPPAICGRMGSIAAAEILGHYGARPETSLGRLFADKIGRW
jgi:sugar/nucleoside kinase (ribokinase family)